MGEVSQAADDRERDRLVLHDADLGESPGKGTPAPAGKGTTNERMPRWTIQDLAAYEQRRKNFNSTLSPGGSVGAMESAIGEPASIPTLDRGKEVCQGSPKSVACCVRIVSFRSRLIDEDNLIAGAKSLRDQIAFRLGADDADPRLCWEYAQVKTTGPEGTLVVITATNKP